MPSLFLVNCGQLLVKPLLQLRLPLPVEQETMPVNAEQLFAAGSCRALLHGIKVQNPELIILEQKVGCLTIAMMN